MANIKKICFYARVPDVKLFETVDFYSNDIKILRELGYDVMLGNSYKSIPSGCDLYFIWWWSSGIVPLIHAKLRGKPAIMIGNLHYGDKSSQGYDYRPFHIKKFINYSLKHSDVQIATSKIEFEDIKMFKAKNPKLIYHAIDENKYNFGIETKEKYFLTISRLLKLNIERKKIYESIQAFTIILNEFPDYKFYIVGRKEDDGYEELKHKVDALGLADKVIFTGNVSDEKKYEYYKKCMIYIQPTSFEGFGMAIAESMACGTPVVTSPNGAVPEVCGNCAVYVNPDDPVDIAEGVLKLLNDKEFYEKLRKEGSQRIKSLFTYEKRKESIKILMDSFL